MGNQALGLDSYVFESAFAQWQPAEPDNMVDDSPLKMERAVVQDALVRSEPEDGVGDIPGGRCCSCITQGKRCQQFSRGLANLVGRDRQSGLTFGIVIG